MTKDDTPQQSPNQQSLNEMEKLINTFDFRSMNEAWKKAKPFNHIVLDDFLTQETAASIVKEFPSFDDSVWYVYENAIEVKKAMNNWDRFGPKIYNLLWFLNSPSFIKDLEHLTACKLYPDFGLNGGGLHSHRSGGKLNTHLDYSIHPKLKLERRLNLIIYITPDWQADWGGDLGLWEHDEKENKPSKLLSKIAPMFNRAVLFDTTQNSWHGLPDLIQCPPNITRNSLAIYYLCDPRPAAVDRNRALFAPHKEQENDPEVLELIRKRSDFTKSQSIYRT